MPYIPENTFAIYLKMTNEYEHDSKRGIVIFRFQRTTGNGFSHIIETGEMDGTPVDDYPHNFNHKMIYYFI